MQDHTDLDEFAEIVQLPDDSDLVNPAAATINVPGDGLLNRTFWMSNRLCAMVALNWNAPATPGDALDGAGYHSLEGRWYASKSGTSDTIYFSRDFGRTWILDTRPVGGLAIRGLHYSPAGDGVLTTLASVQIYDYDETAGTYTARNALTGSPSGATPLYSIPDDLWCVVYRDGAVGIKARTSPDRTAWTTQTIGGAFSSYTGSEDAQAGVNAAGDILAVLNAGSGTAYEVAHSDDGGITWTTTTIATTLDASVARPVYSELDQIWMILAYDTAGEAVEIWTSVTGFGGWVKVYSNTPGTFAWIGIENVEKCWIALGTFGQIYYSLDRGVTWRNSGMSPVFAALADLHLFGGGAGFLVLDDAAPATATSMRLGIPGAEW